MTLAKSKWPIIALCAAGLAVLTFIAVGLIASSRVFETQKSVPTLRETEAFTGVRFPPGSRLVNSYSEGWQDYTLHAVVMVDTDRVGELIGGIKISLGINDIKGYGLSQTDRMNVLNSNGPRIDGKIPAWWQPDSLSKFTAVSFNTTRYTSLLISRDNPKTSIVYVYAFSM